MFARQSTTCIGDINLAPLGHRISKRCNIPIPYIFPGGLILKKDMQVAFLKEKRPVAPGPFFSGLL